MPKKKGPKVNPAPVKAEPTFRYKDMSGVPHAAPLSNYNLAVQDLVEGVFQDEEWTDEYYNHGYDKDPSTNGGAVPGDVSVSIYYFPSTQQEIKSRQTIRGYPNLSGRRRLAVRMERTRYPVEDTVYTFYATNHPNERPGLRTNSYGNFTPLDPKR